MVYKTEEFTVDAECIDLVTGERKENKPTTIVIKHVGIDPEIAKEVFATGQEFGDCFNWKHKIWRNIEPMNFPIIQAAARFYYAWGKDSEKVTFNDDGTMNYEAWYAAW